MSRWAFSPVESNQLSMALDPIAGQKGLSLWGLKRAYLFPSLTGICFPVYRGESRNLPSLLADPLGCRVSVMSWRDGGKNGTG